MDKYLIATLFSPLISEYLPIDNKLLRSSISFALVNIALELLVKLYAYAKTVNIVNKFILPYNYVIVKENAPTYEKILEYFYQNYASDMQGCEMTMEFGKRKMLVDKLIQSNIMECYNNTKIYIEFITNTSQQKNKSNVREIKIMAKISVKNIEEYINTLVKKCSEKTASVLQIYKLTSDGKAKNTNLFWKLTTTKTNKSIRNTIVSDTVQNEFYDDLHKFIENEAFYTQKGLPFKRGYILQGKPGCGKTSLIKSVANEYDLPVFVVDLSIIAKNAQLIKACSEITNFITCNQKYLMIFEDIDRSQMFSRCSSITQDCLLNVLDGVDENYGRIVVMTTNDIDRLTRINAMLRPGRIDRIVEITDCTDDQLYRILEFYFGEFDKSKITNGISITPAKLIQLIVIIFDLDKVIAVLNRNKNFANLSFNQATREQVVEQAKPGTSENRVKSEQDKLKDMVLELGARKDKIEYETQLLPVMSEKKKLELQKKEIMARLLELKIENKSNEIHRRKQNK